MTGEELKLHIKRSGLTLTDVAKELGTTPQNLNQRLRVNSVKSDFINIVQKIIDKCCPPLPAEFEKDIVPTAFVQAPIQAAKLELNDSTLATKVQMLQQQLDFAIKQNEYLQNQLSILINKK